MHVRQGQKIAVLRLELELNKGDVCWLVVPMARDGAADGGNYRDEAEDGVEHGQPRWVSRSSQDGEARTGPEAGGACVVGAGHGAEEAHYRLSGHLSTA